MPAILMLLIADFRSRQVQLTFLRNFPVSILFLYRITTCIMRTKASSVR